MTQEKLSDIRILFNLKSSALEQAIDAVIPEELFNNTEEAQGGDIKIAAFKSGKFQIKIEKGQQFSYLLPIKIFAAKDVGIATAQARGEIVLVFQTQYQINSDWSLEVTTEIVQYKWTQKPILKVGLFSMPIEKLVTKAIYERKETIYSAINQQLKNALDLKNLGKQAHQFLSRPIAVSPQPPIWVEVLPTALQITPLSEAKSWISATIAAQGKLEATMGKPPVVKPSPLPPIHTQETASNESLLHLRNKLSYTALEKLATEQAKNQSFSVRNWSVEVEKVQLKGTPDKLIVYVTLSGAVEGVARLEGKPIFDVHSQLISVQDTSISFETDNFIYRNIFNLAKGYIKKQLEEQAKIDLKPHLKAAVKPLEYYKPNEGITLLSQFSTVQAEQVVFLTEGIVADARVAGKVLVMIEALPMPPEAA